MSVDFSIVEAPLDGVMLIDASAGTGKTYTISSLVVRLLLERGLPIDKILVVTYTEAAADDLKTRIRQKIVDAKAAFERGVTDDLFLEKLIVRFDGKDEAVRRLTAALRIFDEAAIYTIHGFCRRVLNEHSLESSILFDSELITDQHDLLKSIAEDFFRKTFYGASSLVAARFYKEFSPGNLLKRMGNIHAREEVLVFPEIDGSLCQEELAGYESDYRQLFHKLAKLWRSRREKVSAIFFAEDLLNKNKYRAKSIPAYLAAMDGLTSLAEPPAELFDKFPLFTYSIVKGAVKAGKTAPDEEFFELCERFYEMNQKIIALLDDYGKYLEMRFYRYAREELRVRKETVGAQSFDDLLTDLHRALQGRNGEVLAGMLRDNYPAAMIDEFQDTDPVQYEIFSKIFTGDGMLLYLIGDPKQAIYSFRGADIFAYIRAIREVARRYTLADNWRSVPGLINAVNAIFGNSEDPFVFKEIGFDPARPAEKEHSNLTIDNLSEDPFHIWVFDRDPDTQGTCKLLNKEDGAKLVLTRQTTEICRLLDLGRKGRAMIGERPLAAGDLAVLVRTNQEARQVQEYLAGAGITSGINSSESLFASEEAVELRIVLQAIVDAGDSRTARAALATGIIGVRGVRLDLFGGDDGTLVDWLAKFRDYRGLWAEKGFAVMFGSFMESEGVRPRLLKLPGGERSLTNILHLFEVLHLACEEYDLGMAGLVKYLGERIAAIDESPVEEQQLRLESDADLVQIVTIHRAKGLQYPVVFCPFCWGGSRYVPNRKKGQNYLFHDPEDEGRLKLDLGSPTVEISRRHAMREELAENLRLLYVALTRAINRCYLAWGPFSGAGTSAPAYLFHRRSLWPAGDEKVGETDYLKDLSDDVIAADLRKLASGSDGDIRVEFIEAAADSSFPLGQYEINGSEGLSFKNFVSLPPIDWRISSFSALSRAAKKTPIFIHEKDDETVAPEDSFEDIRSFPRGAGPGTFMHSLLEDLDFSGDDPIGRTAFIRERLAGEGYDSEWTPALTKMVDKLLNTSLDPDREDLVLTRVGKKTRLNELEFYFPLTAFDPAALNGLLHDRYGLAYLPADKISGFMKGYIDLVFRQEDKYYIVDWKFNYLGGKIDDYRPAKLREAMAAEHYFLQYLIYVVALHRYLGTRLPGYDYERNFGGVFYVFLRGVGDDARDTGVFRDRPPISLVEDLSGLFRV